jgi:hypothetical protein
MAGDARYGPELYRILSWSPAQRADPNYVYFSPLSLPFVFKHNFIPDANSSVQQDWLSLFPDTTFVDDGITGANVSFLLGNEPKVKQGVY